MENRSRLYGDGFFETIRLRDGEWLCLEEHLIRILAGIDALSFTTTHVIDLKWLESTLNKALDSSDQPSESDLVVRLDFFTTGQRGYVVQDHMMHVEGAVSSIDQAADGVFPNKDEKLDDLLSRVADTDALKYAEASSVAKVFSPTSHLKSTSAITYVRAANECSERSLDDLLILNDKGRACEFISSNLLVLMNGELFAVPGTDGPIEGTMIAYLRKFQEVKFRSFRLDQLAMADMIMRCNSVRGIQRMVHV